MSTFLKASAAAAVGALLSVAPVAGSSAPGAAAPGSASVHGSGSFSGYVPGSRDDAQNARLRQQLAQAVRSASASKPSSTLAATTVYFSTANAPTYRSLIRQGASVWNSSVTNVRLVEDSSRATLRYYEGNDSRGSYASTNGHGSGYILIDYTQARQYYTLRIITHETGHVLGLPDHYSGPCSELMSGGGPGPSCTNVYPNSTERSKVNSLWRNGFTAGVTKAAFNKVG
ncbi:snapalysin family zinc-dependent metalloprotease [Luteipulveratus flavus]|uniref:Extracellular small neutral protease n=1 Tax=Luteipulveratus flavus TaxID=3031728 RepID=A0ABT6C9R6_9MICO|nr:snapalysin family zinc-dependent metalloprotease [Luteipulveratus sp. YIM 133296]MDF8265653.1 snapalysin family zinc-dependent metalloprotease [Luteipulveratus sp. YIM 133296]